MIIIAIKEYIKHMNNLCMRHFLDLLVYSSFQQLWADLIFIGLKIIESFNKHIQAMNKYIIKQIILNNATNFDYYHNFEDDLATIKKNFCLLSYIHPQLDVKINYRHFRMFEGCEPGVYIDQFSLNQPQKKYYLIRLPKKSDSNDQIQYLIISEQAKNRNIHLPEQKLKGYLDELEQLLNLKKQISRSQQRIELDCYEQKINNLFQASSQNSRDSNPLILKIIKNVKQIIQKPYIQNIYQNKSELQRKKFRAKLFMKQSQYVLEQIGKYFSPKDKKIKNEDKRKGDCVFEDCFVRKKKNFCGKKAAELEGLIFGILESKTTFLPDDLVTVSFQHNKNEQRLAKKGENGKPEKKLQEVIIKIKYSDSCKFFKQCERVLEQCSFSFSRQSLKLNQSRSVKESFEYFYQEPENIKTVKIDTRHFSLALKGGGAQGICYIGAYKAFWDYFKKTTQNEEVEVRSIIGSSIGGIFGLAVCCELDPEQMQDLIVHHLSSIIQTDKKYREYDSEIKDKESEQWKKFTKYLQQNKYISSHNIELLKEIFYSGKVQKMLLQWLEEDQLLKEMLTAEEDEVTVLMLYRFAMATLMKGEKVREIGAQIVAKYYNKIYKYYYEINRIQMKQLKQQLSKITLKQFYQETKIEFTVTSIDLDSKIMRFFNHKTTPNLPVCYAIQMSGSFPLVFQAQKWKKQWGKYLIHYKHSRKELSLVGHEFVDGGMLANLPIKFLDNQKMRPKYFAHHRWKKQDCEENNDHSTIIYAFGLTEVTDMKETNNSSDIQQKPNETGVFNKLLGYFSSTGKAIKTLWKWKDTADENPNHNINSQLPPVIKFIFKCLQTLSLSKDNLTRECFEKQCLKIVNNHMPKRPEPVSLVEREKDLYLLNKLIKNNQILEEEKKILLDYHDHCEREEQNFQTKEKEDIVNKLKSYVKFFEKLRTNRQMARANYSLDTTSPVEVIKAKDLKNRKLIQQICSNAASNTAFKSLLDSIKKIYQQFRQNIQLVEQLKPDQKQIFELFQEIKQIRSAHEQIQSLKDMNHVRNQNGLSKQLFEKHHRFLGILELIQLIQQRLPKEDNQSKSMQSMLNQVQRFLRYLKDKLTQLNPEDKKSLLQLVLEQDFSREILCTKFHKENFINDIKQWITEKDWIANELFHKKLKRFCQVALHHKKNIQIKNTLLQNLRKLTKKLKQKQNQSIFDQYRSIIKNCQKICYYLEPLYMQILRLKNTSGLEELKDKFSSTMKLINKVRRPKIFLYSDIKNDCTKLSEKIEQVVNKLKQLLANCNHESRDICCRELIYYCLQKEYQFQYTYVQTQLNMMQRIRQQARQQIIDQDNKKCIQLTYYNSQDILRMAKHLYIVRKDDNFFSNIFKMKLTEIVNYNDDYKTENEIVNYLENTLTAKIKKKHKTTSQSRRISQSRRHSESEIGLDQIQIHLVLESNPMSEQYFETCIQKIQQIVQRLEAMSLNKKLNISSLTGSKINAMAMFLHASNLESSKVAQYINRIKDTIKFKKSCGTEYDKYKWADQKQVVMREQLIQMIAADRSENNQELIKELKNLLEEILQNFFAYLNNISPDQKKNKKLIEQHWKQFISDSIRSPVGHADKRYMKQRGFNKFMVETILKNYSNYFRLMLLSAPIVLEEFTCESAYNNVSEIWKGIIISDALQLSIQLTKIEDFIKKILRQDLGYEENINLKDFYEKSSKKYQCNFTTVDIISRKLMFLNHNTTPYMPLWAAITASMTVPFFMPEMPIDQYWLDSGEKPTEQSRIKSRFKHREQNKSRVVSGDLLSKVPLQLITNGKISKKINGEKSTIMANNIYIAMTFQVTSQEERNKQQKQFSKGLKDISTVPPGKILMNSLQQSVRLSWNHGGLPSFPVHAGLIILKDRIPMLQRLMKYLQIYVSANDKMMESEYKRELTNLPVRIGKLDFKKMTSVQSSSKLSLYAIDIIRQSKFVVKEKLSNTNQTFILSEDFYQKNFGIQMLTSLIQGEDSESNKKEKAQKILKDKEQLNEQLMSMLHVNPSLSHLTYKDKDGNVVKLAKKQLYLRMETVYPIYENEMNTDLPWDTISLRFLSFQNCSKELEQSNIISYQVYPFEDKNEFIKVDQQYLLIKFPSDRKIKLKIESPNIIYQDISMKKIKSIKSSTFLHEIEIPPPQGWSDELLKEGEEEQKRFSSASMRSYISQQKFEELNDQLYRPEFFVSPEKRLPKDIETGFDYKLDYNFFNWNSQGQQYKTIKPSSTIDAALAKRYSIRLITTLVSEEATCLGCYSSYFKKEVKNFNKQCSNCSQSPVAFICAYGQCKKANYFCINCAYRLSIDTQQQIVHKVHKSRFGLDQHIISKIKRRQSCLSSQACSMCSGSLFGGYCDQQCGLKFCSICIERFFRKAEKDEESS